MNIKQKAIADWNRLSQSAFGLDLIITTPDGSQTATIQGIGTDIAYNMETDGQDASVRNVHIGFNEAVLLAANPAYPVRNADGLVDMHHHRVSFEDAQGIVRNYSIKQIYPDNTVGMIMCDCSDFNP